MSCHDLCFSKKMSFDQLNHHVLRMGSSCYRSRVSFLIQLCNILCEILKETTETEILWTTARALVRFLMIQKKCCFECINHSKSAFSI